MPKTVVRENETLDDALRRFKRQVNKAGTIQECRKREAFLKKSLKRKLKSENARRKNRKQSLNLRFLELIDSSRRHRGVEQLAARQAHNLEVGGSSPSSATK